MRRIMLRSLMNDFSLISAGFLAVIIINLSIGSSTSNVQPLNDSFKNASIKKVENIKELNLTIITLENGMTCVKDRRNVTCK